MNKEILRLLPEKKSHSFANDVYCSSCRCSETFCQCEGFNKCRIASANKLSKVVASDDEIKYFLSRWAISDELGLRYKLIKALREKFIILHKEKKS